MNILYTNLILAIYMFQAAPLRMNINRKKLLSDEALTTLITRAINLGVNSVANFYSDEYFPEIVKNLPGNAAAPKGTIKHIRRWKGNLGRKRQSYYPKICDGICSLH
jgi:hypothetical protein